MRKLILALVLLLAIPRAFAVEPGEVLDDPVLEARARVISEGLRCVVCQNQSIDSSNADLARDMRVLVRERLTAGDTNQQVTDYMVSRYGDFVLLDPPFKSSTYALWLGPELIIGLGLIAVVVFYRRRSASAKAAGTESDPAPAGLSDEERKRLEKLLESDQV